MRVRGTPWLGLLCGLLFGCGGAPSMSVGPVPDAGEVDAGAIDAGAPAQDAGPDDAGPSPGSGLPDAGPVEDDAGPPDPDAGPPRVDASALPCTDALDDVYVTPSDLPALTDAARGDVVRCAADTVLDASTVASETAAAGATTPMQSGVALYRIAFRTTRGDGSEGVSTARVYLPATARRAPVPLVVIGHPTTGLAATCTPSENPSSNRDLALPWAGLGFPVIVPDYAGQGNGGAQGYLDNRDQAHSLLDGARALRKLLDPGALDSRILAVGYSQGGGAVLSVQALARSYGADGDVVGVIAFAPEWPSRLNSFGYVDMLRNPNELTIQTGISNDVVAVLRAYAYFYNRLGSSHAGDGFPAGARTGICNAVTSLCETPLGGYLQGTAFRVGQIFDDGFRTALLACIDQGSTSAGCTEPARSYHAFLESNVLTADPAGAPVLLLQGLADVIMPAASEAACNVQKLQADGVSPQVCVDPPAQHTDVVNRNIDFALRWGQALLDGRTLPACAGTTPLPSCQP